MARTMLGYQEQELVDHPIITRCTHSSPGLPSFTEGSPYLFPEQLTMFIQAMRDDISLMEVQSARKVFRHIMPGEEYPAPETCTPYVDANSLGFYLKPLLPLVFVRTTRGETLSEARVALKYLRENARQFSSVLDTIEHYAHRVFIPEAYADLKPRYPRLFSDVVQPYNSFTSKHLSIRAGIWAHTPIGVSTVIGPLINQQGPLSILTGSVETDWHHFELFVVVSMPEFDGQVFLVEPDAPIAQLYFISRAAPNEVEVRFSSNDPGAEPNYAAAWEALGKTLVESGKGTEVERHGVSSVSVGCPHCYVSITAAVERGVPDDHIIRRGFNPAYKILKQEYHKM